MKNRSQSINEGRSGIKKFRTLAVQLARRIARPLAFVRWVVWPPKASLGKMEGVGKDGQSSFTILCGLNKQIKSFFLGLAFADSVRAGEPQRVTLRKLFSTDHELKKDCSLIVVELKQTHYARLNPGNWFFIPLWVRGEITLPIADKFLKHESVKSDLRRIRNHAFEYEVTLDGRLFDDFFDNMHVPYINKVHGEAAKFASPAETRKVRGNSDLLLVKKRGQPDRHIAGILIVYEPTGPRLWSLGIRDGNLDYVREGVVAALYHFSIHYLMAKGFLRINIGGSRPFLQNGVLQFKRKMSQTIIGSSWEGFALKILSYTPATKAFLQNNPFIFVSDDVLYGAIFTDFDRPLSQEKIQQLDKDYFHPGLAKLFIYCFNESEATKPDSIPPALAERIVIRSANDLTGL
jgi:hypothetical protein